MQKFFETKGVLMTKKILSTVAAAALISTSAMAFDVFDDGVAGNGLSYTMGTAVTATTPIVNGGIYGQGDALIFPAYYSGNGYQSTIKVINTSGTNAIVAKVVLFAGDDSRELRDFNIYLSANDVWEGTIAVDANGVTTLISTDDSSPIKGGGMASVATPMVSESIAVNTGYIQVIGCAAAVDTGNAGANMLGSAQPGVGLAGVAAADYKSATAHADHAALRTAYTSAANTARVIGVNPIFSNGVITSAAQVPAVNAATAIPVAGATTATTPTYFFGTVPNTLIGEIRVTDTVNGKDMVMPATKLRNVTEDIATNAAAVQNMALMFVEGEAASIADRNLMARDGAIGNAGAAIAGSEYFYAGLSTDAAQFASQGVRMTYGDTTKLANNRLQLTSPYKRLLINADASAINASAVNTAVTAKTLAVAVAAATPVIGNIYSGVQSANNQITNWGAFQALTLIYDMSENLADSSQFSPASTPTLNFKYEMATSEDGTGNENLSYYIDASSFAKGYVDFRFITNGAAVTPSTIATQMIATEAAGKTITNWIVPNQY